jgi:signal transduction histidine kinase
MQSTTRLNSGYAFEPEPLMLVHVARKGIASYRARHRQRDITLHCEARQVIVEADRGQLEMVIENLLANADNFSLADTPIEIVVGAEGGEARMSVLDRGIGISTADSGKVFLPFYRSETSPASRGGLGIGLAVCKRVVDSLGGRIWAAPRQGGGSEVGLSLPLAADDSEAAA